MAFSRRILLQLGLQAFVARNLIAEDEPRPRKGNSLASNYDVEAVQKVRNFKLNEGHFVSSSDGTSQPFRYYVPESDSPQRRPLLVFLHSWSADYRQYKGDWIQAADSRNWIFLQPNFRGANNSPMAGGSIVAQQDVLDCIDWAIKNLKVDLRRIYLAGASGGGHMAMLLAGRHPHRFSAVSAWVGISDLKEWYKFQSRGGKESRYAQSISAICGGPPGTSPEVDAEYEQRSPINWISQLGDLPIDLAAGVYDGTSQGSVPITHTLNAFNAIAHVRNQPLVTESEITQLVQQGRLSSPSPEDIQPDPSFEREIRLRRHAGNARLTIFDGGHEAFPEAACTWLEGHQRRVKLSLRNEAQSKSEK
jgi:Dipeptidyl aminopeptidases/acylaminoacyl-peptidases